MSSMLLQLEKIYTDKNSADIMTKVIKREVQVCNEVAGMMVPLMSWRGRYVGKSST